ncbi:MAG: response regulator transcription factor [Algicola sp.]|nr:response regulator transcription factor [Algicola sp.]
MSSVQVLIVEDDPFIAEDIREALTSVNYNIVAIAHNKRKAIEALKNTQPNIILLDINLGDNLDGILIAEIINRDYQIPFLYLTSYSNKEIIDKVKHTLPMGYIVKPFDETDLFTAIEIAISNYTKISKPKILSIELVNKTIKDTLTQKEFDILMDIYHGKTNNQMAEQHFVSINTIKSHIKNIYGKMNVHSRSEVLIKIRETIKY